MIHSVESLYKLGSFPLERNENSSTYSPLYTSLSTTTTGRGCGKRRPIYTMHQILLQRHGWVVVYYNIAMHDLISMELDEIHGLISFRRLWLIYGDEWIGVLDQE